MKIGIHSAVCGTIVITIGTNSKPKLILPRNQCRDYLHSIQSNQPRETVLKHQSIQVHPISSCNCIRMFATACATADRFSQIRPRLTLLGARENKLTGAQHPGKTFSLPLSVNTVVVGSVQATPPNQPSADPSSVKKGIRENGLHPAG